MFQQKNVQRTVWSSVAVLWIVTCGCKATTDLKQQQLDQELAAEESGELAVEENEAGMLELQQAESELQRKAREIEAQLERQKRYDEAFAMIGDEPGQALTIVDELLAENVKAVAAHAAREADETVEPEIGEDGQMVVYAPPMTKTERARFLVLKGSAHYNLGDTEPAIAAYSEAFDLDSSFRACRLNLGKLYFQERQYEKALEVWNVELAAGFRSGDLMFLIGQALYEVGRADNDTARIEAAREAVRASLIEMPDDPEVIRWMAVLEFETGRYGEAARLFQRILKSRPLDTGYLELLANSYIQLEKYTEAIDAYETIARIESPDRNLCLSLSDLYSQIEMPERAARWLERAYESRDAMPPEDVLQVGLLYMTAGHKDKAIAWLESVPEASRVYRDALVSLPYLYLENGDERQARAVLPAATQAHPQDGRLHLLQGDLELEAKEYDEAASAYGRASGLPGTKADGFAGLAEVAYAKGDLKRAVEQYQRAILEAPEEKRFLYPLQQIESEYQQEQESKQ